MLAWGRALCGERSWQEISLFSSLRNMCRIPTSHHYLPASKELRKVLAESQAPCSHCQFRRQQCATGILLLQVSFAVDPLAKFSAFPSYVCEKMEVITSVKTMMCNAGSQTFRRQSSEHVSHPGCSSKAQTTFSNGCPHPEHFHCLTSTV